MSAPSFSPNPFANRAMIADKRDFFGRRREIEQLLGRLLGGSKAQSCALVGQRRIGKSSLFRRLVEEVPARDPGVAVAYYDLEAGRKLSAGRFYAAVLRRLARAAGAAAGADRREAAGDVEAYDALVEFLERQEGQRRFVLLLDEFDTVTSNPDFDADFFGSLRYLANNHDLAFVTSSYEDLTELCHAEEVRQSPFFNVFTILDLRLMARAEIEEMIDALARRGGRVLTAEEREAVLRLGGSYPFFVQVAGSAVWEQGSAGGRFAAAEVEARFREEATPHFRYFVDHLDAAERAALYAIGRGEPAPAPLVHRLQRRSLVVGGETPGLFSPVFADYVRDRAAAAGPSERTTGGGAGARDPQTTLDRAEVETGAVVSGRYELARRLGTGAFGVVYQASDRVLGRPVALKFLRSDESALPDERAERLARFRREAQALARMKHPNVVTIYDLGEWAGKPYIAMELVAGGTLGDLLTRRGQLEVAEAAAIVAEAALGLGHAHGLGVVHRDVKPANLMLEPGGRVRVADFGVLRYRGGAAAGADVLTCDGRAIGTPAYMAPEQLRPGDVDHRADLYALGVVLYECLAGRRPFASDDLSGIVWHVLFDVPPDPRRFNPGLDEEIVALVRKAMAKEASARFASGEEMARALARFQPAGGTTAS